MSPRGRLLLAAVSVALLVAVRRPVIRRLVAVVVVAVVLRTLPVRLLAAGWPPPGWVIVACAVGQGDAVVLPVAAGRAVVVDAGPDSSGVDGCLRRLGVREVSLLVVSHFHADHVGGVAGVFRGRRVAAVATPQWSEPPYGVAQVRDAARRAGSVLAPVPAGWRWRAGAVELVAIGPPYPLRGSRSDPNNNSLVLAATVHGVRILLPGDAETEEQRALLDTVPAAAIRADVLKVAHHGLSNRYLAHHIAWLLEARPRRCVRGRACHQRTDKCQRRSLLPTPLPGVSVSSTVLPGSTIAATAAFAAAASVAVTRCTVR